MFNKRMWRRICRVRRLFRAGYLTDVEAINYLYSELFTYHVSNIVFRDYIIGGK